MRTPLLRRLSIRVRILCVGAFVIGAFLPPYIPPPAEADTTDDLPPPQFQLVEDGFLMKTSTVGDPASRLAYSEGLVHRVQAGESLNAIAQRYGISAQTIRWANKIDGAVQPGQELVILPVDGVLHTVTRGQTIGRIAELYGVSAQDIVRQNKIRSGYIVAGEQLIIPGGKPITNPAYVASNPQPQPQHSPQSDRLQFANRLPDRNIALNFQRPAQQKPPVTAPARGGGGYYVPGAATPDQHEQSVATSGLLQMPCNNCYYTQFFHKGHFAVDIQTRGGGPIFAAEAGTVIRADTGWNGGYGNVIEIDHGNGLVTLYGHNKELYVQKGDRVERGQQIAWMGNTGFVYGQTGIHTHFEVRQNGVKKDPRLYLSE